MTWLVAIVALMLAVYGRLQLYRTRAGLALALLHMHNERGLTGRELVQQSGGALKPGTIYVILDNLERNDFISSEPIDDPGAAYQRRRYKCRSPHVALAVSLRGLMVVGQRRGGKLRRARELAGEDPASRDREDS